MRRKYVVIGIVAGALAAGWFLSPTARGASLAALHQVRGRSALYRLGCVMGPSSDPAEFRFEELLAERYGLYCETTGGYAPTDDVVGFTRGYNFVTVRVAQARHGTDFYERTHAEAAKDVLARKAVVKGCFDSGDLQLASGEHVRLMPLHEVINHPLFEAGHAEVPVTVWGTLTTVRAGEWNRWFGPILRVSKIESDPDGSCFRTRVGPFDARR
ncbi:MAG TPA: hypothetical protein VGQ36_25905 [Thermoanaerobaculia bacterium]|jgi:hypothetical protein|nr:hypothetical protein [Thermoanaerobaculia bacterium]